MEPAEVLFSLFADAGEELYLVGGFVRDRILGRDSGDLDLATSALPEKTSSILESAGLKPIPIGMEFGTVGTLLPSAEGERVEAQITTYRCRESYRKGSRLPVVVFGRSLEEDLVRRDFTINSMAMDSAGEIVDPLDGRADLEAGLIRTPLDPFITFREDPLRMLRAFRFSASLGFSIDPPAIQAVSELHGEIVNVARERWKIEMDGMFSSTSGDALASALEQMRRTGLLSEILPEMEPVLSLGDQPQGPAHTAGVWEHTLDVVRFLTPADHLLRWAALLHDIGKPSVRTVDPEGRPHFRGHEAAGAEIADVVCERFRFSKKDRRTVTTLVRGHMRPVLYSGEWSDRAVRRLVSDSGEELERSLALARADIMAHTEEYSAKGISGLAELRERIANIRRGRSRERILPKELGRVLFRQGNGPVTGVILDNLEELVMEGVLPAKAPVETYLDYIEEHPEICIPGS